MKKTTAEPYRDIDFSTAKRGAVIPAEPRKTKISICVDNAVIDSFDKPFDQAGASGCKAQTTDPLADERNGIPLLPSRNTGAAVTLQFVNHLRDEH